MEKKANEIRGRKCFTFSHRIASKCTVENANLQKTGNGRSAWPRSLSDDDSPKRADWQFPDPILAGFFSLSLSSASTSNECNLPRCFFTE